MTTPTPDTPTRTIAIADLGRPSWALAAIVAEHETDISDLQTDYFNTRTDRVVFLAWSKHKKDVFSEMRKAAARFPETAHLGPGCDVYRAIVVTTSDVQSNGIMVWTGAASPWHRELYPNGDDPRRGAEFTTRAAAESFIATAGAPQDLSVNGTIAHFTWQITQEKIEHREKYSMGAGYYLKGSGRYSHGWKVRKIDPAWRFQTGDTIEILF